MGTRLTPDRRIADRAEFLGWAERQPCGRYERLAGTVVAMSPERWEHARLKAEIWRALDAALPSVSRCQVVPDGMTVAVDDDTDFEPDVAVHCGEPIPGKSLIIPNPVVVVEVLSPSTKRIDTSVKVDGYFRVPSVAHYLVFRADRREVMHWCRGRPAPEQASGVLVLDPPGLRLDVDRIYERITETR